MIYDPFEIKIPYPFQIKTSCRSTRDGMTSEKLGWMISYTQVETFRFILVKNFYLNQYGPFLSY